MLRHTQRVQKIVIEHCSSLHLGEAGLRKLSHETLEDHIFSMDSKHDGGSVVSHVLFLSLG